MKINSFNDSHMHFLGIGYNTFIIDLSKSTSINKIIDELSSLTNNDKLIARGWNQSNLIENRYPTKQDLNKVSNNIPIILIRTCGHVLVCNEVMMELAGINELTPQIEGGTFDYNTGIFTEKALNLIYKALPKPSKEEIKQYFIKANEILLRNGVTSIGSDDFSTLNVNYELILECLEELYEDNLIQVRLYEQVNLPNKEILLDFINKGYANKIYKGFKLGPLKLLADGSLGGRTAFLNNPYTDDPNNYGIKVFTQEELNELVYIADSNNMDVAIHAIGDGTIDMVIDAIWNAISKTNRNHHRHSIIHAQLATKSQIKRMRDLNIAAQVQPIFINSDMTIVKDRLGERSKESYLFNTMYKEGVHVSFGTDSPVESVNPFHNLYSAITRKSIKNPKLEVFLEEEKFSIKDALKCYTVNPYYLSYDENNYKEFKDYIILDRDIIKCTPKELLETKVLETYMNGKLVYKNKRLSKNR